jgi:hypothetical protein
LHGSADVVAFDLSANCSSSMFKSSLNTPQTKIFQSAIPGRVPPTLTEGHRRSSPTLTVLPCSSVCNRFGCHGVGEGRFQSCCETYERRAKPGAKGASAHLIAAVLEMKRRTPKFGCLRAAQQISYALGVDVCKDVVRRILQQHCPPGPNSNGPSSLTDLAHAKDSLWSLDLFRCESITLRSCWVLAIIDVFSRRFVGLAVEHGAVDGPVVCRMLTARGRSRACPSIYPPTPIPCSDSIAGSPTYAYSTSRKSNRSRTRRFPIPSLSEDRDTNGHCR